jgi:tetratricopeptide (TPR) repeat protein
MKRRALWAIGSFVALLGVAALAWRFWPSETPQPPALDPTGVDPVVWRTVEAARREAQQSPKSARAWGRLGMVLLAHQFRDESIVCLARAEHLDPRDARWPYYQALAMRRSDPETAIACLRRAVAASDEFDGPLLLLAELLAQNGQDDEARTLFQRVLHHWPDHNRAHLGLARLALEGDDLPLCRAHLLPALDDPHARKAASALLAEVEQRRGDRAAAEEALSRARRSPDDLPWSDPLVENVQDRVVGLLEVVTRAAALLQQKQAAQAIPLLQRAIADYPDSSWARILLGRAYLASGDLSMAEETLRAAVERDPGAVEGQFYLGATLSERKEYAAAIPYFQTATRLKSDYALAWYNLGVCYKQQGDRAAARAAYRSALACKPLFAEAHLNLGELLAEDGETDAALEELRQGVHLKPEDAHARQLLESLRSRTPPQRDKSAERGASAP